MRPRRRLTGTAAALVLVLGALPAAAQSNQNNAAPPPPNGPGGWQVRGTAELQALDKVYARRTTLRVKVGTTTHFGTLAISVGGCVVRPADQAPDAAAYLTITEANAAAPGFRGWMFAANPALSMLAHPIYDIRVTGCRE